MKNVREIQHPLVQHHLARLRDRTTPPEEFRHIIRRLAMLLTYEATADLALRPVAVRTPLARAKGHRLTKRIGLVPILRAGLGMVDPVLDLIPGAEVWHLGFYRDENTLQPVKYYEKLAASDPVDVALVLDPMLATGGSAVAALTALRNWGVPRSKLLAVIAAPEGVRRVSRQFPRTPIHVCAIDHGLDRNAYIRPGLGDAGDRTFNTRA
jgi:uracil phosphoribosyltransferase